MKEIDLKLIMEWEKIKHIEDILIMGKYCLFIYIKSTIVFGCHHEVSVEVMNIWKEYFSIIKQKFALYDSIKEIISKDNISAIYDFLEELDNLDASTLMYYFLSLEHIEEAIETKEIYRAKREKKNFNTLIETDEYIRFVKCLKEKS